MPSRSDERRRSNANSSNSASWCNRPFIIKLRPIELTSFDFLKAETLVHDTLILMALPPTVQDPN